MIFSSLQERIGEDESPLPLSPSLQGRENQNRLLCNDNKGGVDNHMNEYSPLNC